MKKLSDLIVEQFLPQESGPGHAVLEAIGLLLDHEPQDRLHSLQGLDPRQGHRLVLELRVLDVLAGREGRLSELPLEHVPGPLQSVLDGIWEVFECADGDGLLRGVPGAGVRLSHVGKDDLCVALGAEGARLKEGLAVVNTPRGYNMNL